MDNFFEFAELAIILTAIIVGLFLILLSLPASRLRQVLLKIFSGLLYSITGLCVLYILSPVDFIPDVIPILGQVDDGVALITAIFMGIGGTIFYIQGRTSPDFGAKPPSLQPPK